MLFPRLLVLCGLLCHVSAELFVTDPVDEWGSSGTYSTLSDIDVDTSGNVYVLDSGLQPGGSQVFKFSASGTPDLVGFPLQAPTTPMSGPFGLSVNDAAGLILVGDMQAQAGTGDGHPRLVIFDISGTFIRSILVTGSSLDSVPRKLTSDATGTIAYIPIDADNKIYVVPTDGTSPQSTLDGSGNGAPFGTLSGPNSVVIDPADPNRLYIADTNNDRIVHLEIATNTIIATLTNPASPQLPIDITFDTHGDLYVIGSFDNKIYQLVGSTSTIRTQYSKSGLQTGGGLAVNPSDQVLIGDTESQNVLTFNPAQVSGDPMFLGFQQQSFQVHGASGEYFNLITSPSLQINSRFIYIASGSCTYNETECWTHPGTYVDQLGLMLPGLRIHLIAGPHSKGLHLLINEQLVSPSDTIYHIPINGSLSEKHVDLHYVSMGHVMITTPLLSLDVMNSDSFFNLGFSLHPSSSRLLHAGREKHVIKTDADLITFYPDYPLHGLVGQTWRNARYADNKAYQGDIHDYLIEGTTMFSNHFMYSLYQHTP